MKLNKEKVYDLSDLTSEERKTLSEVVKNPYVAKECESKQCLMYNNEISHWQNADFVIKPTTNAKELFYTLENIQVDCSELTEEQIKEMCKVFEIKGYGYYESERYALKQYDDCIFLQHDEDGFLIDSEEEEKTTITYEKFMELFSEPEQVEVNIEAEIKIVQFPEHYDNTNGSIYKFCND